MNKKRDINLEKVPQHVAIIMDGNGRWAKNKGMARVFGHKNALTSVRESIEGATEIGVKAITLYAFSTENWNRPKLEVNALMSLLVSSLKKEFASFQKNGVQVSAIGNLTSLPKKAQKTLNEVIYCFEDNQVLLSQFLSFFIKAQQ